MSSRGPSLAMQLAALSDADRRAALDVLSPAELELVANDWRFVAREEQTPPEGDWDTWVLRMGRGGGKSWTASNWAHEQAQANPGLAGLIAARTSGDVRETMIEGISGILATAPPGFKPRYEPSKRKVTWPNSAYALCLGADEPELFRGKNSAWAVVDELASWRFPDAWDQLQFGLRVGEHPRCLVATTPKPTPLIRAVLAEAGVVQSRGSTYDNAANLAPAFLRKMLRKYEGTSLGAQELHGELLGDTPGALWKRSVLDQRRVKEAPDLVRIVVAVDPAASSSESADDTGIVAVGKGRDGHGYVLTDATCHEGPIGWATIALRLYHQIRADRIVGEVNNGGEMVETTIRAAERDLGGRAAYASVHASRGKQARAEPISALYETGWIHHVGMHADLESELTTWVPGESKWSPNRLDALVWACTELFERDVASVGPAEGLTQRSYWTGASVGRDDEDEE